MRVKSLKSMCNASPGTNSLLTWAIMLRTPWVFDREIPKKCCVFRQICVGRYFISFDCKKCWCKNVTTRGFNASWTPQVALIHLKLLRLKWCKISLIILNFKTCRPEGCGCIWARVVTLNITLVLIRLCDYSVHSEMVDIPIWSNLLLKTWVLAIVIFLRYITNSFTFFCRSVYISVVY